MMALLRMSLEESLFWADMLKIKMENCDANSTRQPVSPFISTLSHTLNLAINMLEAVTEPHCRPANQMETEN